MGLAILPARLKDQSAAIADILTGSAPNTSREAGSPLAVHADWIDGLIKKYGTGLKREKAEAVLRDEIGIVFSHVLENAGVFKQDAAGQAAFLKFMESVGYRKASNARSRQKRQNMLVTSSALDEEASAALIGTFKSLIEANGTIDSVDDWGKRRLAYPIEDETEGVYTVIKFTSEPDFPAELDRNYRITEGVLRSIIVAEEA